MKKVCVTGAYGFIGQSLCQALIKSNISVRGAVRSLTSLSSLDKVEYVSVGSINAETNWRDALVDSDCVIHCAGKTPATNKNKTDDLVAHYSVDVDGAKRLAEQAVEAGIKRLVFLSSVKVNGESTDGLGMFDSNKNKKKVFTYNDSPAPKDFYGVSKFETEKVLWEVSARTGLEVIVLRVPLVYGKGAKGNLVRLLKLVRYGVPLPFGAVHNQRSLIGLDNLVDLLIRCIDHPSATGKTFLVSDGEDLSTQDLLRLIAFALGRSLLMFPVPVSLLKLVSRIIGIDNEMNRLLGSLRIDSSYTRETLNWKPSVSVAEGIRRMVQQK